MMQGHYVAVLHLRRVVAPTCGGRRLPALGRAICALGSLHMTISPQRIIDAYRRRSVASQMSSGLEQRCREGTGCKAPYALSNSALE
jgi:hypothetical protein